MTIDEAVFYLKIDRQLKIDAMSSPEVAKKTCTVIAYDMAIEALEKQKEREIESSQSLDSVIKTCEEVSKEGNKRDCKEKDSIDKDER